MYVIITILGRSRKDPHSPHRGNFWRPEGEGRKNNSNCIRTSKGGRGFTSNFLCGGGMDVFWNDPLIHLFFKAHTHVYNDKIIK